MRERTIIKFILGGMVLFSACYYDAEQSLYPTDCVTASMSYEANIAPILQANCYECHRASVNSGNVTLDNYNSLMAHVINGKLLGAIKHSSGVSPMPQNAPQLGACQIAKIEQWIIQGAQNN